MKNGPAKGPFSQERVPSGVAAAAQQREAGDAEADQRERARSRTGTVLVEKN